MEDPTVSVHPVLLAFPVIRASSTSYTGIVDYVLGIPKGEPRGTVFLVHGFQDLWYGWRHQIPALLMLGLRVVAIDCLGYGGTVCLHITSRTCFY